MAYCLLTGPTGLLGSYLLRDALEAGRHMAVVIRPTRSETVRDRVESMLARLEKLSGRVLPRPVVIEGDLTQPGLGIDAASVRWIARHCDSVLHSAANLAWEGDPPGEPWLSNLQGTQELLELCRVAGIRRFHHVSTAYVCGQREGRVQETELDEGQQFNNDYERSKAAAEKLLRGAEHLDSLTVYRPSIIVGDSRTGFSTAFHGLYLILKLVHTLASRVLLGSTAGDILVRLLSMKGTECKNLVPVDWVSSAITSLWGRPECHGATYHLVTPHPMPIHSIASVFQAAVENYSTLADESDAERMDGDWFGNSFQKEMTAFEDYLRHDPEFSDANTTTALPELPCPTIDEDTLLLMAKVAINSNFGKPKPRPVKPAFDVAKHLEGLLRQGVTPRASGEHWLGLQVDGPGGGQWKLLLDRGCPVAAQSGLAPECSATYLLNSATFGQLATEQLSVANALASGRMVIQGNGMPTSKFIDVMELLVGSGDGVDRSRKGSLAPAAEPNGTQRSFSPQVSLRPS